MSSCRERPLKRIIHRGIEITDPALLVALEEILTDPEDFYLNVHTQSHPPGIFRGQLRDSAAPPPELLTLEQKVDANSAKLDTLLQNVAELENLIRTLANSLGLPIPK